MKTLIEHSTQLPDTKNNGQTLSMNGLRKIINTDLMNESLQEARDLWVLSFILMGIDVRELLTCKHDEVMEGIFLAYLNKDDTSPLPLHEIGFGLFQKYRGKYYALKFLEIGGTPGRLEGKRKANRLRFDLNRRMEMVSTFLKLNCSLCFENIRIMWMLLAKEAKMDQKTIGLMSDFTGNVHNRKINNGSLERIAVANNKFIDDIYGTEKDTVTTNNFFPHKQDDGSILLFEG